MKRKARGQALKSSREWKKLCLQGVGGFAHQNPDQARARVERGGGRSRRFERLKGRQSVGTKESKKN